MSCYPATARKLRLLAGSARKESNRYPRSGGPKPPAGLTGREPAAFARVAPAPHRARGTGPHGFRLPVPPGRARPAAKRTFSTTSLVRRKAGPVRRAGPPTRPARRPTASATGPPSRDRRRADDGSASYLC